MHHGMQRRADAVANAQTGCPVKFVLIDRIVELEPGQRVVAQKALTLAEEYLQDHFPKFPVLPGVLLMEAMVQASAWVVREKLDFGPSIVMLHEARNVTYKSFLAPGQTLTVTSECKDFADDHSTFAARGEVAGKEIVKGRLHLRHLNLADTNPDYAPIDERLRARSRDLFELIWKGSPARATSGPVGT